MPLAVLDLALRSATVALLLVLGVVLLRDFRGVLAGRLAAAFALGSAAHALTSGVGVTVPFSIWHAPLIALSTGNAVVFWLFTRALFDDAFRMRRWHGLIWIAVTAFSFVNCLWIAPVASVRVSVVAVNLLVLGFIALAGIIVRNSILLVDFIRHGRRPDRSLREVLLEAGAVRFKPILLTALAAMIGAATILVDPIFQGLAISLLFGLASSTLLTVLVIPAIYVVLRDDGRRLPGSEQNPEAAPAAS